MRPEHRNLAPAEVLGSIAQQARDLQHALPKQAGAQVSDGLENLKLKKGEKNE